MDTTGIIAIIVLGLLVTALFTYGFKNRGPWNSVWTFLLIQILCLWVVSVWVPPVGPVWFGTPWIDLLITAFFVAFIMAAFTPSVNEYRDEALRHVEGNRKVSPLTSEIVSARTTTPTKTAIAAGSFFWMLLLLLTVLIIVGAVD